MYSNVLGIFLGNIKALRYYVNSVDVTIDGDINNFNKKDSVSSEEFIAMILKGCVIDKQKGVTNTADKVIKKLPENTTEAQIENIKKLYEYVNSVVDRLNLEDKNAYSYTRLSKEIKEEFEKIDSLVDQKAILYNGSLMLLITYYENLVANSFKSDFIKHPERIKLDSKGVTYKVIVEYNDLELIREHLVEEEVTSMMYKSHEDWMAYFSDKIKLDIPYIKDRQEDIKEIIARRNLLVHNNGIVNSIYLSITQSKKIKKGTTLRMSKSYLNKAINIIEAAGLSLAIELWLKEYGAIEDEVEKVSAILYSECLEAKKWELGKVLFNISYKCKHLSDAYYLTFRLNMWQCCKWLEQIDDVKKDILELDVSAKLPRYKLAILALLDKEEEFWLEYDKQSDINENALRTWPIFNGIRDGKIYNDRHSVEEV